MSVGTSRFPKRFLYTVGVSLALSIAPFALQSNYWLEYQQTTINNMNAANLAQSHPVIESHNTACIRHNSLAWLHEPRHGNTRDVAADPSTFSQLMMFEPSQIMLPNATNTHLVNGILSTTMCHERSALLNVSDAALNSDDERLVRLWAVRLIFLATHYNQHKWARREMLSRHAEGNSCKSTLEKYNVGPFDYECPGAKHLVFALGGNGLGANVRGGLVMAFLAGLATNRVVHVINNAPTGTNVSPWTLASCERKDLQCVFMPPTPCVLTYNDLETAYSLNSNEVRDLWNLKLSPEHEDERVIIASIPWFPFIYFPELAAKRLYDTAMTFIKEVPATDPRSPILLKAAESILVDEPSRPNYNFAAATPKIQHVMAFYAMRPNHRASMEMDKIIKEIVPSNFTNDAAIGLPIRASDKCNTESECLSYYQHMQLSSEMWADHLNGTAGDAQGAGAGPTIILTTESVSILHEYNEFLANSTARKSLPFYFDFLRNTYDVTPDTGSLRGERHFTADEAMLSSLTTLKLQLHARLTIGNCCSNYHILLSDFLVEGCGAAPENTFRCMQETKNVELRVCCGWHRDCHERKKLELEALRNRTAVEEAGAELG